MKSIRVFLSDNFQFLEVNFSWCLNRRIFAMSFHYGISVQQSKRQVKEAVPMSNNSKNIPSVSRPFQGTTQQAHNVKMTSYQRRCDVITSHRRWYDVILMLCACWVDTVGRVSTNFSWESFITFFLLSCSPIFFRKEVGSERKEFAPRVNSFYTRTPHPLPAPAK